MPEVLIIGFGAVGTIYGYVLTQAGCSVTAVARSAYPIMSEKGIDIHSEKFGEIKGWRPTRLVKDADEANDRVYDYIICTFKALPDLLPTSSVVAPFLDGPFKGTPERSPTLVLIQNGIGIETDLQTEYPHVPIISVVAWIGVNLLPNAVVSHGLLEKLILGLYIGEGRAGSSSVAVVDPAGYTTTEDGPERLAAGLASTKKLVELLQQGGANEALMVEDIQAQRYSKNLWNASLSSLCTLSRSTVAEVVESEVLPFTLPVVRRTMLEVLYVARAWGYTEDVLPASAIDNSIKITIANYQQRSGFETPSTPGMQSNPFANLAPGSTGKSPESTFKPSMLLDVEANRPCELEVIVGALLDRARAKGVETPRLDLIYASLKPYQVGAVGRAANSPAHQSHILEYRKKRSAVGGGGTNERQRMAEVRRAKADMKVKGKPVVEEF